METKLKELHLTERKSKNRHWKHSDWFIMHDSVMTVHVIDGRQLGQGRDIQPVLKMSLGSQHVKTTQKRGPEPIWDEDFHFSILDGTEVLHVELWNGQSRVPGTDLEISLKSLIRDTDEADEIDQMKKDQIYDLGVSGQRKVRLELQWIYSRVKLLDDLLNLLNRQAKEDQDNLKLKQDALSTMRLPFLGLFQQKQKSSQGVQLNIPFSVEVSDREQQLSTKVDQFISGTGMRPIKWAKCTYILTVIYTLLVMVASLARADSMNVTVCTLALYFLTNTNDVKNKHFRLLVLALALSLVYDLIYLVMKDGHEGQLELVTSWVLRVS